MSVKFTDAELLVGAIAFEVRFDDGYRYFDHCGESMSRIRSYNKSWKTVEVNLNTGRLLNTEHNLICTFNHERLSMMVDFSNGLKDLVAAETAIDSLSKEIEPIYDIVVTCLSVPNTTRVGARIDYVAASDSLEDAEQFCVNATRSKLMKFSEEATKSQTYAAKVVLNLEDQETGYRRNLTINPVKYGRLPDPVAGFGDDNLKADSGVQVQVDTYTRPASEHFLDARLFFINSMLRAKTQALSIYHWMKANQND